MMNGMAELLRSIIHIPALEARDALAKKKARLAGLPRQSTAAGTSCAPALETKAILSTTAPTIIRP